jgi:hypothetical protein
MKWPTGFSTDFYCWSHDKLLPRARRFFKLPEFALTPDGSRSVRVEVHPRWGQLYRHEGPDPGTVAYEDAFMTWHNQNLSTREIVLERAVDLAVNTVSAFDTKNTLLRPQKWAWPWARVHDRRQLQSLVSELANTRLIRYVSYHSVYSGESAHIDGRIVLPSGAKFDLDFSCVGGLRNWSLKEWELGVVVTGDIAYGDFAERTILIPTRTLFEDVVREALIRWYMQRFEYERGHWAVREHALPEFVLDIGFFKHEDKNRQRSCRKRVAKDKKLLRALNDGAALTYPRFGRVVSARERKQRGF